MSEKCDANYRQSICKIVFGLGKNQNPRRKKTTIHFTFICTLMFGVFAYEPIYPVNINQITIITVVCARAMKPKCDFT